MDCKLRQTYLSLNIDSMTSYLKSFFACRTSKRSYPLLSCVQGAVDATQANYVDALCLIQNRPTCLHSKLHIVMRLVLVSGGI